MCHDLSVFIARNRIAFLEINMNSNMKSIVGIIYTPCSCEQSWADVEIFTSTLHDLMEIINMGKRCVVMGYFNIDLINFKLHDKTNENMENIFAHNYMPVIHRSTSRLTHSSSTLIDHIYANGISTGIMNAFSKNGTIGNWTAATEL